MLLIYFGILLLGFVLLIKGADVFVDGSANIARNFNVSKLLIGLTVVAFGTSAPEMAVSIKALLAGSNDIALGNVIGSNILNIFLIVGACSLVHPLVVKKTTVQKELPILLGITFLFVILMSDKLIKGAVVNDLTRLDGFIILAFFGILIWYLINISKEKDDNALDEEECLSLLKSILYALFGLVTVIIGSHFVVDASIYLAGKIGINEKVIGLTIVAFGTSLPELTTSLTATKKGEFDMAIGNVIGSNIFNIGVVLGFPITFIKEVTNINISGVDILLLLLSATLLCLFALKKKKITKVHGCIFLALLIIYYTYLIYS